MKVDKCFSILTFLHFHIALLSRFVILTHRFIIYIMNKMVSNLLLRVKEKIFWKKGEKMKRLSVMTKALSMLLVIVTLMQIAPLSAVAQGLEDSRTQEERSGYSTQISQDAADPVVLKEDKQRRESNVKYFTMSNGTTKAAIYPHPVHYQDEKGVWQDIDNTLTSSDVQQNSEDDFSGYENRKNSFQVKFAKNSRQKKLMRVKMGNRSLSFSLQQDSRMRAALLPSSLKQEAQLHRPDDLALRNTSQKVSYPDILPQIDLEYIVTGAGVKENILVKAPQNAYRYVFQADAKGLSLILQEDGSIRASDSKSGEAIFLLPAPFMIDAAGEISHAVQYSLQQSDKKTYELTITADSTWMNDEARAWPVTIDPGIQTEQTSAAMDSVYVASGMPTTNRWSDPMIMIGKDSAGAEKCQGLLKFNLPAMNRGDVVIGAQLSALQIKADAYSTTTPDTALEVHAVTSGWNKNTVTWNTKPSYEAEAADFEILKASQKGTTQIQRNWDVTSIVKRWYENPNFKNYGFLLRSSAENVAAMNDSCIYAWLYGEKYSQDTSGYPILTISFRSNKGLESYWSYTTLSAGRAGTASICDFSGNLVFTHEDAATPGSRAPTSVSHVFNNYMAAEGFNKLMPYRGHGWMLSCQQQLLSSSKFGLTASAQQKYPYVYIDGDGTEHYFLKKSDGTMIDEDGLGLTLTIPKTSNNFYYKVADDTGNAMWFNVAGALAKTVDSNGNQAANYYPSPEVAKINKVTDGAGHALTIAPTGDDLAIQSVTDTAGRTTNFNWSTGRLRNIVYPDGKKTEFAYDGDGAITSVKAPDGYELQFSYTSLANGKRVSKVVEKTPSATGQTITFDYSQYGATVMRSSGRDGVYGNSDDILTTTRFDSAGRTVSSEATCNGKSLGASSAEYTADKANSDASNIKQLNRISKSMASGQFVRNYLTEGSADQFHYWPKGQWNGTADYDAWETSTDQLFGRWSYYINSKSMSSRAGARSAQTLTAGKFKTGTTYTFSAWVKTDNVTPLSDANFGAELMATYWLPDNSTMDFHSESIIGTTDRSINNGWQRISVTFAVPSNATQLKCNIMLRDSTGKAWFDGMQLEEGTSANPFNLVNNASFENYTQQSNGAYMPDGWAGYQLDAGDTVNNAHVKDASHAFRYTGVPTVTKEMHQDINLGGKTANLDDTYILSGWVYADPVGGNNENNRISLLAKVFYSDNSACFHWFDFNRSVKGWQYLSGAFTLRDPDHPTAAKTPTIIRIYPINYRQANMSWFDNIQLVRDEAPSYTYDKDGKLVTVAANAAQNSKMEYSNQNLIKSTDPKGYQYSYQYDSKHNMTQATSQSGTRYCYQYDANGNPTSLSIKGTDASIETSAHYTANGAFTDYTTDQDGVRESYQYNDAKGTLTSFTAKNGSVTNYTYDANTDALTGVSQTLTGGQKVQNGYTYENDHLKTISHNGFQYSFAYDSFGNVTQTKVGGQTLSTNTYGANNGDLKTVAYGNGDTVGYTYDDYGNVTALSQNGQQNFTWSYDSTGNLHSHDDLVNNQRYLYTYDTTGRLIRQSAVQRSNGARLYAAEYGYDLDNNVTRFSSSAGGMSLTEQFTYGKDNLPATYTLPNGKQVSYTHNSLNQRTGTSLNTPIPVKATYQYMASARNASGQTQYTTNKIQQETLGEISYRYAYDAMGNITSVSMKYAGETTFRTLQQFAYDELNQLIRADDLLRNRTEVYTYDAGGNILSVTTYPLTWGSLSGITSTGTISYGYTDANWKDKLTSYNGQAISYDAIGNPLSWRGYTLAWQNGRQLTSLNGNGTTASYTYDTDGLRTSKTVNGVKHEYYYIGDRLQYEKYGNTQLWFFYDSDGTPSGLRRKDASGTDDYYFLCNWRGDVSRIFDSTGGLIGSYEYDAWGNVQCFDGQGNALTDETDIVVVNPIRYRGYYYDAETGLYYISSRYYDPSVKRMLNSDDESLSAASLEALTDKNYFAYCDNNPVGREDVGGEFWHIVAGAAVGGVLNSIDTTIDLVSAYRNGGDVKKAWLHLGVSFTTGAVSGGLAMTGVGAAASVAINAASSGIGAGLDQWIDGQKLSVKKVAFAAIEGGVTGASKGSGTKKAMKAGKDTIRKTATTFRKVNKSKGIKAAAKAYKGKAVSQAKQYVKSTKGQTKKLFKNVRNSFIVSIVPYVLKFVGWIRSWF